MAERRLPQPRLVAVKRRVPSGVKRLPKAVQAAVLTGVARRLRREVEVGDAVLVSSSVRSGSTWLFEMLASDPAVLPVFEPFHPQHNPHMAPFVDELGHLLPPVGGPGGSAERPDRAAASPRAGSPGPTHEGSPPVGSAGRSGHGGAAVARPEPLVELIDETLAGRRLTRWSASRAPRSRLGRSHRTLVKEVRMSRALPWLLGRWPVAAVVLVRHPCAVVESMLRADPAREWLRWPGPDIAGVVRRDLGAAAPAWLDGADRPRLLAALWAVETRAALAAARRAGDRGRVVTYEELVRDPEAVVGELAAFAGLHDVAPDPGRLSYMTNRRSPLRQGADPLSAWVDRLDRQLAEQVVATVHELGVTFYTHDPEPDRSSLAAALAADGDGPGDPGDGRAPVARGIPSRGAGAAHGAGLGSRPGPGAGDTGQVSGHGTGAGPAGVGPGTGGSRAAARPDPGSGAGS